jgi:hypothetical protein
MDSVRSAYVLGLVALLAAFMACGGSRSDGTPQRDPSADGEEQAVAAEPVLIFDWTGGFAGFMRHLEIDPDGLARAEDRRFRQAGEVRLAEARFDSLMYTANTLLTESAGPYSSGAMDDFHFVVVLKRAEGDSIRIEGDGLALPDSLKPLMQDLTELTGEILTPPKPPNRPESQ